MSVSRSLDRFWRPDSAQRAVGPWSFVTISELPLVLPPLILTLPAVGTVASVSEEPNYGRDIYAPSFSPTLLAAPSLPIVQVQSFSMYP